MSDTKTNPFRSGMLMEHPADPCVLIILGATGDLAQRKLFPSLAHLVREGRMSEQTQFLAVSRKEMNLDEFRTEVIENAKKLAPGSIPDDEFARRFAERILSSKIRRRTASTTNSAGGWAKWKAPADRAIT